MLKAKKYIKNYYSEDKHWAILCLIGSLLSSSHHAILSVNFILIHLIVIYPCHGFKLQKLQ